MQTAISDILHVISQALLIPDIILLLALIAYAVFCIGSILVEWSTEHRRYKVKMPELLSALTEASMSSVPTVIQDSGLLRRQREALMTVYEFRELPGDALIALVRRLMNQEESHYSRITTRNNMAARVAPMLGLVGTLIPLGPGIQALGNADTEMLSSSLLVAFDTTVAGLVTAAVCLVIGKIRSGWYDNYLSALDSAMATLVQKIDDERGPSAPAQSYGSYSMSETFSPFGASAQATYETAPSGIPMAAAIPGGAVPMAAPVDGTTQYVTPSGMPIDPNYGVYGDPGAGYVFEPTQDPFSDGTIPVD